MERLSRRVPAGRAFRAPVPFETAARKAGRYIRLMAETSGPFSFSADLSGCAALPQLTGNEMAFLFLSAVTRAGGQAVDVMSHAFPGVGLTCAVILRQSHAVLHTWPGSGTINLDIYSSGGNLACMQVITDLGTALGAAQTVIQEHARREPRVPTVQAV